MEGIGGVAAYSHVMMSGVEYERARTWMTKEVNAAILNRWRHRPAQLADGPVIFGSAIEGNDLGQCAAALFPERPG